MDVTLRDGSYSVNFQMSQKDTMDICRKMEQGGIGYIEIGHGMGLRAGLNPDYSSLCTDIEYLEAAKSVCRKSLYGMFLIPGIGTLEDVELLKKYGGSFIRIGTDGTRIQESAPFIRLAKDLGLEVMVNYMKSYVMSPVEFSDCVKYSEDFGADVIYVVDSAGCMNFSDIKNYFDGIRSVSSLKIGFHGHDNMGMAVANSLYAIDLGYDLIDVSLQKLGRGAGNASLEHVVSNLIKNYAMTCFDFKTLVDAGEEYVRKMIPFQGFSSLDVYSGFSGFHSSYMKYIQKYAMEYALHPFDLMYAYSQEDKVNLNEERLKNIARSLWGSYEGHIDYNYDLYFGNEYQVKDE